MTAAWATIKPLLKSLIAQVCELAEDSVVWSKSGYPFHDKTMLALLINDVREVGIDEKRVAADGSITICGMREFALTVLSQTISHEDTDFSLHPLSRIRTRFQRDGIEQVLNNANLALLECDAARERTFTDGEREWSAYGFDMQFRTVASEVDSDHDNATIESVSLVGEFVREDDTVIDTTAIVPDTHLGAIAETQPLHTDAVIGNVV